jgi:uncharacterized protein YraI
MNTTHSTANLRGIAMQHRILALLLIIFLATAAIGTDNRPVQAQAANLLRDPGFEGEAYKTVSIDPLDPNLSFNVPVDWNGIVITAPHSESWMNIHPSGYPHTGPIRHGGFRSLHVARGFATFNAIIFQQVSVQPNTTVEGGAFAFMDTPQGLVRAGIDPDGGTNPFAPGVVWSNWAAGVNAWVQVTTRATARAGAVTLFLQATQLQPSNPNGTYWDDAFLNGVAGSGTPAGPGSGSATSLYQLTSNVLLRVRRGPSLDAERFGSIFPGQYFDITGQVGQWYEINYYGERGYVAGWLAVVSGTPGAGGGAGVTPASGTLTARFRVNVRSGPGTDFSPIGHLNAGETRPITGQSGDWYAIDYNGRTGYVAGWLVTIN